MFGAVLLNTRYGLISKIFKFSYFDLPSSVVRSDSEINEVFTNSLTSSLDGIVNTNTVLKIGYVVPLQ